MKPRFKKGDLVGVRHASDFCFYDGILADVTPNGGHFDEVLLVRWEDVVGRVLAR